MIACSARGLLRRLRPGIQYLPLGVLRSQIGKRPNALSPTHALAPHKAIRRIANASIASSVDDIFDHEAQEIAPYDPPLDETELAPTSTGFALRPYQHAAIEACLRALDSGLTRLGVSSPTGSGKTTMFMSLIPRITQPGQGRVLIVVSSIELAHQTDLAAKKLLGEGWSVEVDQGSKKASGLADV
jgi:superfamily II DNA or RNA helicase